MGSRPWPSWATPTVVRPVLLSPVRPSPCVSLPVHLSIPPDPSPEPRPPPGKTTLIRALTGDTAAQPRDQLFTTLDVTAHAGWLPSRLPVLYVDTVGFLSQLPHGLIQAFNATLDDVAHAVSGCGARMWGTPARPQTQGEPRGPGRARNPGASAEPSVPSVAQSGLLGRTRPPCPFPGHEWPWL